MLMLSLPHGPALGGYPGVGVEAGLAAMGSRQSGKVLPFAQSFPLICTSAALVGVKVASTFLIASWATQRNATQWASARSAAKKGHQRVPGGLGGWWVCIEGIAGLGSRQVGVRSGGSRVHLGKSLRRRDRQRKGTEEETQHLSTTHDQKLPNVAETKKRDSGGQARSSQSGGQARGAS